MTLPAPASKTARALLTAVLIASAAPEALAYYTSSTSPRGMTSIDGQPGTVVLLDHAIAPFDEDLVAITLPFDFEYYGAILGAGTNITVSVNGAIVMGPTNASLRTNRTFATTLPPDGIVAPVWDSLRSAPGSKIMTRDEGSPGQRTFIIEWKNLVSEVNPSLSVRAQLVLHESGLIEFRYPAATADIVCESASIGLEDPSGNQGLNVFFTSNFQGSPPGNVSIQPPAGADFLVSGYLSQTHVRPGDTIAVMRKVLNRGVTANNVSIQYALSSDRIFDPTDLIIANESIGSLSVINEDFFTFTTPPTMPPGPAFLVFVADPNDQHQETVESNNEGATVEQLTVGAAHYKREVLPRSFTTIVGTAGSTVHFDGNLSTIPPDGSSGSVLAPLPFPFVFFGELHTEVHISVNGYLTFDRMTTNATNNIIPSPTRAPAGLIAPRHDSHSIDSPGPAQVVSRTTGAVGQREFTVEWSRVSVTTSAGDLSFQVVLSELDRSIEFRYPDPATQSSVQVPTFTSGLENSAGDEGYGGKNLWDRNADAPSRNYRFTPPPPALPDLAVSLEAFVTGVLQGQAIELERVAGNAGAAGGSPINLVYYVSDDLTIDATDMPIGQISIPAPGEAGADVMIDTLVIPTGLPNGRYHLGAVIDPADQISESDETNNSYVLPQPIHVGGIGRLTREALASNTFSSLGAGATPILSAASFPSFNNVLLPVTLPFEVRCLGRRISAIQVSSNGWLSVLPTSSGSLNSNTPLFSPATPRGLIAAAWDNLTSNGINSKILTAVRGAAPNRTFVVEWSQLTRPQSSSDVVTAQVHLFEAHDRVELHYPPSSTWSTGSTTVGIAGEDPGEACGGPTLLDNHRRTPINGYRFESPVINGIELVALQTRSTPERVPPGYAISLTTPVRNFGSMDSVPVDAEVILSQDPFFDSGDTVLEVISIPTIAAGTIAEFTATPAIPAITPPGIAYVGLRVDSTSVLSEASTANNNSVMADIQVTTMSAQPDLTVAILSLSDTTFQIDGGSTSQPPESGTIEFEVTNHGTIQTPLIRLATLLSSDLNFDPSDRRLSSWSLTIPAGATVQRTEAFGFPAIAEQIPGTHYISAFADVEDAFSEADESNNFASPIQIELLVPQLRHDYLPTELSVTPTIAAPGSLVTITATFRNLGATGPVTWEVTAYSAPVREIRDTHPALFTTTMTQAIPADDSITTTFSGTIPTTFNTSFGFLGLGINAGLQEPQRANNFSGVSSLNLEGAVPFVVDTGFTGYELSLLGNPEPSRRVVTPRETLTISTAAVANCGNLPVTDVVAVLLLDTSAGRDFDYRPTSSALMLGSFTIPSIAPGGVAPARSLSVAIPEVPPGLYTIGMRADSTNLYQEARESDNSRTRLPASFTINPTPLGTDLAVPEIMAPTAPLQPGDSFAITRRITNLRANPARPFQAGVFLSTDPIIDGNDMRLETLDFSNGLSGDDGPTTTALTLPAGLADGTWYVGIIVDETMTVFENEEGNNTGSAMITVRTGLPCDVNLDGSVNVTDVQTVINVALGVAGASGSEDVNSDASVNVSDVQLVINGALGGACP